MMLVLALTTHLHQSLREMKSHNLRSALLHFFGPLKRCPWLWTFQRQTHPRSASLEMPWEARPRLFRRRLIQILK